MNIRKKLTIRFVLFVAMILIIGSTAIYFFSAHYRQEDFYNRMKSKSYITTKLLMDVEEMDANMLAKIEKDNPVSLPFEKLMIFNEWNEVLYTSDQNKFLDVKPSLLHDIRTRGETKYLQGDHEILAYVYKNKLGSFVVMIGAVDVYGWRKIHNLRNILIIVLSLSIILALILGWFYAGRALRPITTVISQVNGISIRNLDRRVDEGNGLDEIAQLAATFNNMLSRLERSFKMQENFIANASHELRTPLAAISGQLEVVLLKERKSAEYKSVIVSVLEEINHLIQISNHLLLLAQTSAEHGNTDFRLFRIDEIIWQSKADLLRRFPDYNIDINISPENDDAEKLTIMGSEQLIRIVLLNLMDNGCKYSPDQRVMVNIAPVDHQIPIEFCDKGIGISKADQAHLFEPFHRGRNAFHVRGHGIGLSLADMIMKLHHGSLSFTSVLDEGSSFVLKFPLPSS